MITVIIFFVMDSLPPLLALARGCKFISNVCPLAERATLLSSWLSGPMVRRLKSWMKITVGIVNTYWKFKCSPSKLRGTSLTHCWSLHWFFALVLSWWHHGRHQTVWDAQDHTAGFPISFTTHPDWPGAWSNTSHFLSEFKLFMIK